MNADDVTTNPGAVDVLALLEGSEYPSREVVLFTDPKSGDEYVKLVTRRNELDLRATADAEGNSEDVSAEQAELTAQIEQVGNKLRKSSLIFTLRGMAPGIVQDMYAGVEDGDAEAERAAEHKLIAHTIVGVKTGEGATDNQVWDAEKIGTLRKFLKEGEFGKLIKGVVEVNFDANLFDKAVDAGFSR